MTVEIRGLGQPDQSPITRSAAWLATASTLISAEAAFAPYFRDPYAHHFAEAIAPDARARLAALSDAESRRAFLSAYEAERSGCVGVVLYRKPWFERQVRAALAQGARQLVILGAGCDTLAFRLAADGVAPDVYELDVPAVTAFRDQVAGDVALELPHVRRLGVDFERDDFRAALLERGYRRERSVFVAEGVLEYIAPPEVDVIFEFVRDSAGPQSTMIFSFTEPTGGKRYAAPADAQVLPGEKRKFELDPSEVAGFLAQRGFALQTLWTAKEIRDGLMREVNAKAGAPVLGVVPFMHFAVAVAR